MDLPIQLIVKVQQFEDKRIEAKASWNIKELKGKLSEIYPTVSSWKFHQQNKNIDGISSSADSEWFKEPFIASTLFRFYLRAYLISNAKAHLGDLGGEKKINTNIRS